MSYVCYILQSLSRPEKTYIGITTDLERRLQEHNGELNGGAARTRRYRPWIVAMHVRGFARKSAALAFEYQWSHFGNLQNFTPQRRKLRMQLEILGYILRIAPACLALDFSMVTVMQSPDHFKL